MVAKGRSLMENEQLAQARETMIRVSRMAGGYPPVQYYLGQIARAQGNTSAALAYFDRALELDPTYALPHLGAMDALLEAEAYERAMARADSALTSQPYWTLYFRKAKALIGMEDYEEARAVLRGRCEPLNDESFDLYITLGDTYMASRQWSGARWAYEEAGSLQPNNQRFSERMDTLRSRLSDAGVSFQEIAPEETTRSLSGGGGGQN
jgi:tetratricopeptide (TPR) repeat protein